jgi:hypothetical protein
LHCVSHSDYEYEYTRQRVLGSYWVAQLTRRPFASDPLLEAESTAYASRHWHMQLAYILQRQCSSQKLTPSTAATLATLTPSLIHCAPARQWKYNHSVIVNTFWTQAVKNL